jgi:hypothetical protein
MVEPQTCLRRHSSGLAAAIGALAAGRRAKARANPLPEWLALAAHSAVAGPCAVIKERHAAADGCCLLPPDIGNAIVRPVPLATAAEIIGRYEPMPAVARYSFGIFFGDSCEGAPRSVKLLKTLSRAPRDEKWKDNCVSGLQIAAVPEAIGIDGGMEGYFGAGLVSAAAA